MQILKVMTKSDENVQKAVEDTLKMEPFLTNAAFVVTVVNGNATISGSVDRFAKKEQAEWIAKQVTGIKSVFSEIDVNISTWEQKNDADIKTEVLNAFRWNWNTLNHKIIVKVENANVTLSGELEWKYQKDAAMMAVSNLIGVKGIINNIIIAPNSHIKVSKTVIERALKNHVDLDIRDINVEVNGKIITLTGSVETWFQKELASRIAWKAPGVENVCNNLKIKTELMAV